MFAIILFVIIKKGKIVGLCHKLTKCFDNYKQDEFLLLIYLSSVHEANCLEDQCWNDVTSRKIKHEEQARLGYSNVRENYPLSIR